MAGFGAGTVELEVGEGPTEFAPVNLLETILVYKLPRLSREEIRKMLDIFNVELKQTRFYQDVFAEGLEEGRQREAALVLRLLRRRLGKITVEQEARVRELSVTQLEALGEALLDFAQPEDVTGWFEANL
jgi:predicted transposase YdaD